MASEAECEEVQCWLGGWRMQVVTFLRRKKRMRFMEVDKEKEGFSKKRPSSISMM